MKAIRLRTEYLYDPVGIDIRHPRLMWNAHDGVRQTAYQIVTEKWDSGKVASSSMHADYPKELSDRERVNWKIRLTIDDNGDLFYNPVIPQRRKTYMKKVIALFIAFMLLIVCSACSNQDDSSDSAGSGAVAPAVATKVPRFASVAVGDLITFGTYEQDNNPDNGPEPIEWVVLDVKDHKALVISKEDEEET